MPIGIKVCGRVPMGSEHLVTLHKEHGFSDWREQGAADVARDCHADQTAKELFERDWHEVSALLKVDAIRMASNPLAGTLQTYLQRFR